MTSLIDRSACFGLSPSDARSPCSREREAKPAESCGSGRRPRRCDVLRRNTAVHRRVISVLVRSPDESDAITSSLFVSFYFRCCSWSRTRPNEAKHDFYRRGHLFCLCFVDRGRRGKRKKKDFNTYNGWDEEFTGRSVVRRTRNLVIKETAPKKESYNVVRACSDAEGTLVM